jgi:hypothetical protein
MGSITHAAVGFRAHTGWAAAVTVVGPVSSPKVVGRRRVVLTEPGNEQSAAVYHAVRDLPLAAAEKLVQQVTQAARRTASAALRAMITELRAGGYEATASGVVLGTGRLPSTLEAILRSHPLVHTAEGELFRQALIGASEACDLRVTGVVGRELYELGSKELGMRVDALRECVTRAGRGVGKPWGQDEKESMLVAWLAMATDGKSRGRQSAGTSATA